MPPLLDQEDNATEMCFLFDGISPWTGSGDLRVRRIGTGLGNNGSMMVVLALITKFSIPNTQYRINTMQELAHMNVLPGLLQTSHHTITYHILK